MKRCAIFIVLLSIATAALAFDPLARGNRIGVLDTSARYQSDDAAMALAVQSYIREELHGRGFEVFEVRTPYEALVRSDPANADYYVEVGGTDSATQSYGEIGIGTGNVFADLGLVVSHVATRISVYDGRTLEPLRTFDLRKRSTAVVPTDVGVGGVTGHLAVWAAVPVMRWIHFRNAAHAVAREAAAAIADELKR